MAQILLHKQPLTPEQVSRLDAQGVIAIHTRRPQDFQFLDLRVPQLELNDMVWSCLDAISAESAFGAEVNRKFVRNLAKVATEKRSELIEEPR